MSKHMVYEDTPNFLVRRLLAAATAGTVVYGLIQYVPDAVQRAQAVLEDFTAIESDAVFGVPSSVEAHQTRDGNYWLQVEQCPQDISAAIGGTVATSFDTRPGRLGYGCFSDWVSVDSEMFAHPDGATITFDGDPTEHLSK